MIGVMIVALLGPPAFRKLEKDKSRNEMKQSLLTDLNSHDELYKKGIRRSPHTNNHQQRAFWDLLPVNGFKGVVSSDRYDLLSPETKETFSEYYGDVQRMNERVKKLEGEEITLVIQKIGNEQNHILINLRHISPKLRSLLE
jgi:hypothetical protein